MSDEWALIDSNVIVYALYKPSEFHLRSRALLNRAQVEDATLCVMPQVLTETYAVITDPRRVSPPFTPADALDAIGRILGMPGLTLFPVPNDVVTRWMELVRSHPVKGNGVFDLQLVAMMLGNGVRKIHTFNRAHFERFPEIEVLTP